MNDDDFMRELRAYSNRRRVFPLWSTSIVSWVKELEECSTWNRQEAKNQLDFMIWEVETGRKP